VTTEKVLVNAADITHGHPLSKNFVIIILSVFCCYSQFCLEVD